jgi:signal transduction histidine kinase
MALQPPAAFAPARVPTAVVPDIRHEAAWLSASAEAGAVLCWGAAVVLLAWLLLCRRDLLDPRAGAVLLACVLAGAGAVVAEVAGGGLFALGLVVLAAVALAVGFCPARHAARGRSDGGGLPDFLATMPEAIFLARVTADGLLRIEAATPGFARLLGIPAERVAGGLPAPLAGVVPGWRAAAARGETVEHEATVDILGTRRCLRTVLVPQRDAAGNVAALVGWVRDVTAARRLEQGLAQSARLATVGTMCAGLAHEASQPLNAATLWLRRVRSAAQGLPEASRAPIVQAAQVVDDQLRRAGALIGQIRSLAEEDPRTADTFDAALSVAAAMRLAAARYAAEGIAIVLGGAGAPLPVRGSAARLEQAVLQLLSNACDAVLERRLHDPAAPARVEVLLRCGGAAVAIEVRDSGTGVPEELASAIFDPFFTTKEPGRGSGLGLALAAGVARAMGGGIETWNLASGGACFRMELALADPVPDPVAGPLPSRTADAAAA